MADTLADQIAKMQTMAVDAMKSPDHGLNFMQAARNFFMGNAGKLRAALDMPEAQARMAELPDEATLLQLTADFMDKVLRSGEYPTCLVVFYNQATDAVSGVSSLKSREDIPTNIAVLEAYANSMRYVYQKSAKEIN